jgi:hypothetical protein
VVAKKLWKQIRGARKASRTRKQMALARRKLEEERASKLRLAARKPEESGNPPADP